MIGLEVMCVVWSRSYPVAGKADRRQLYNEAQPRFPHLSYLPDDGCIVC
jgi:hypothetical protein